MTKPTDTHVSLSFGTDKQWQIFDGGKLEQWHCRGTAVEDIAAALRDALAQPLGFPSFDQAIVPGDTIAITINPNVPRYEIVVASVVEWLIAQGSVAESIQVVVAGDDPRLLEWALESIRKVVPPATLVHSHDPDDMQAIAYVAANEASDPIYINRVVVDADVVIPISLAKHQSTVDYSGCFGDFPYLSNRETRQQFHRFKLLQDAAAHTKLKDWADQAAWWLGAAVAVKVIPGANGEIAEILSGTPELLEPECQLKIEEKWPRGEQGSDLVIALLDGDRTQQNWSEVARILHISAKHTKPGGTIAVCSEMSTLPNKGLRVLRNNHFERDELSDKLDSEDTDDAMAAAIILQTTADFHVYLASELRRDTVEGLGLAFLDNAEQLSHLISQHRSCLVLESAQHWW